MLFEEIFQLKMKVCPFTHPDVIPNITYFEVFVHIMKVSGVKNNNRPIDFFVFLTGLK